MKLQITKYKLQTPNYKPCGLFCLSSIKSFARIQGPIGMGDLLEFALLGSGVYPRLYTLDSRLKLFTKSPLAAGGRR